ncbi:TVP38/TMEM64 family protein [Paenibacillus sp. N1-5-1-14]|uniref:TVP38/TMEM64 family protein n=1 Tax=Paenibacillus radicibacter TaxID=2972488 RepID=UPI002158AEDE|nr:TVP38/TMEM64 family protein [Paenibacillus radicibacter]MCR8644929.1 TVP38/TMEM64 family protein [Paenibacillus radicibacter]
MEMAQSFFTEENFQTLLESYRSLGPFPALLAGFLKAFIPPLPFFAIIAFNAAAFGLWQGFIFSWIGAISGAFVGFLLFRKIAGHRLAKKIAQKPKVQKSIHWIQQNAFNYVFILCCFPIGPSATINFAAGIARMPVRSFFIAMSFGKAVMVFMLSYVGADIMNLFQNPMKITVIVLIIAAMWLTSKKLNALLATR